MNVDSETVCLRLLIKGLIVPIICILSKAYYQFSQYIVLNEYKILFCRKFGDEWEVSDQICKDLESFTCLMYKDDNFFFFFLYCLLFRESC